MDRDIFDIDEKDLHWLAGLFEGEGCFMPAPPSQSQKCSRVSIRMTDLDVLEKAATLLNVKVKSAHTKKKKTTYKDVYEIRISGLDAHKFMKVIYPLMGYRRKAKIEQILKSVGYFGRP